MLTKEDLDYIEARGNSDSQVLEQYDILKKGISFVELVAPAIKNDGIMVLAQSQQAYYETLFDDKKKNYKLIKFVPASGAATRMFKFLYTFLANYDVTKDSLNGYINKTNNIALRLFFVGIEGFPFYKKVRKKLKKANKWEKNRNDNYNKLDFIKMMLTEDGFDFGNKPKGLLPFHRYKDHVASPFEEHLYEAAAYSENKGVANVHFTISEAHYKAFKKEFVKRQQYLEDKTDVTFNINYSFQSKSSDTIALTESNDIVRDENNQILFRPGGHGALISNLNDIKGDIVFIKNIDNVTVNTFFEDIVSHKKILAGILIETQEKVFEYLRLLDTSDNTLETSILLDIYSFLKEELNFRNTIDFELLSLAEKLQLIRNTLNKPLRICGMVKNEGEPGGGPFWVRNAQGEVTLQIIESVQIDAQNEEQQSILKQSTHFNPVDIVCGLRDYKGNRFNIHDFVDQDAGFIATKSYRGKEIKVLEHPGLWNGGMAHWNTIFVEVPLITFNPVKTVNDLLKPTHQVK